MKNFVHLHSHTEYSLLDGKSKIKELVDTAIQLEMPAIAITDHGSLSGAFEFYHYATEKGIKPIIGCEFYVAPYFLDDREPQFYGTENQRKHDVGGGGSYTHLTVLAKSATGLRNLFKLQYIAYTKGFYGKPRIDYNTLYSFSDLLVLSGCAGSAISVRLRLGQDNEAKRLARQLKDVFGDDFYIEIMDHGIQNDELDDKWLNSKLIQLATEIQVPVVATNDNHYTHAHEKEIHDALLCVGTHSTLGDDSLFGKGFSGNGYHLRCREEMGDLFPDDSEVLDATEQIAERIGDYREVFHASMPLMPRYSDDESYDLTTQTQWGLEDRFPNGIPGNYLNRVSYELEVITNAGYAGYFLTTAAEIQDGRNAGIRIGPGRGSVGGSLVAWCLGITEIDPIAHGLMFERFLNPQRLSMPDIDTDIDDSRRSEFINLTRKRYGSDRVAQISTYGVIKAKGALRDATRVLGYAFPMGEALVRSMPPDKFGRSAPLSEGKFDWISSSNSSTVYQKIVSLAQQLEGTIRTAGAHAGGVVISPVNLDTVIPVRTVASDKAALITSWTMEEIEKIGLIKKDYLGLATLGVIDECLSMLHNASRNVDLPNSPNELTNAATFDLLSTGNTLGIFQLDSIGMRKLLRTVHPTKFGDISAVLALFRPGPMGVKSHNKYAARKNGRERVEYIHSDLEETLRPILEDTYGLIVYQEQVMLVLSAVADYDYATAENILYAMRKKKLDALEAEKPELFKRMSNKGYSREACETLWEVLLPFADYSFNKSHTAAYGLIAYWTAYLKANHPIEYMAALLTHEEDPDKTSEYLQEITRMGIQILPPDINTSQMGWTPTKEGIRYGLKTIKGLGAPTVKALMVHRPFNSLDDFFHRAPVKILNAKTLTALVKSGSLDSLQTSRESLLQDMDSLSGRALRDRDGFKAGNTPLVQIPYSSLQETPRDVQTRQKWEEETLGVKLSQPTITLGVKRYLNESEWEYIKRVIDGSPGITPIQLKIGRGTLNIGTVNLTDNTKDSLRDLGVIAIQIT